MVTKRKEWLPWHHDRSRFAAQLPRRPTSTRCVAGSSASSDLGSSPDIDADGDVTFTVNDQNLFIPLSRGELQIMRIFGQWQLPEPAHRPGDQGARTCNRLNLTLQLRPDRHRQWHPRRRLRPP